MAKRQKPEQQVQKAIMQYLTAKRILHHRMQTGALKNHVGRLVKFGTPGMADILAFPRLRLEAHGQVFTVSHPLWIECKSAIGRVSPDQRAFATEHEAQGHTFLVARSIDDVSEWVDRYHMEAAA